MSKSTPIRSGSSFNADQKLEHLQGLVSQLLNDLPTRRDWLDPVLESALKDAVKTPSSDQSSGVNSPLTFSRHMNALRNKGFSVQLAVAALNEYPDDLLMAAGHCASSGKMAGSAHALAQEYALRHRVTEDLQIVPI